MRERELLPASATFWTPGERATWVSATKEHLALHVESVELLNRTKHSLLSKLDEQSASTRRVHLERIARIQAHLDKLYALLGFTPSQD